MNSLRTGNLSGNLKFLPRGPYEQGQRKPRNADIGTATDSAHLGVPDHKDEATRQHRRALARKAVAAYVDQ